jgi:hypothetical protein
MAMKINLLSKQTKPSLLQRVAEALPFGKKAPPLPTRGGASAREPKTNALMYDVDEYPHPSLMDEQFRTGRAPEVDSIIDVARRGPPPKASLVQQVSNITPGKPPVMPLSEVTGGAPLKLNETTGKIELPGAKGSAPSPASNKGPIVPPADQFTPTGGMAGAGGWLEAGGGLGTAATAGIGGVAAFATGDWTDVPRGALTGATLGFGARYAARGFPGFAKNISKQYPEAFGAATLGKAGELVSTYGADRHAMFAGAALGGAVFGHRKKNHSRGFNQTRGSRI